MKVELSSEAIGEIIVHELRYWRDGLDIHAKHKDDKKRNKEVIKACKVLLEFYGDK